MKHTIKPSPPICNYCMLLHGFGVSTNRPDVKSTERVLFDAPNSVWLHTGSNAEFKYYDFYTPVGSTNLDKDWTDSCLCCQELSTAHIAENAAEQAEKYAKICKSDEELARYAANAGSFTDHVKQLSPFELACYKY